MDITVDKKDLINLVKGCHIPYAAMNLPLIKSNGSFCGSYGRWNWQYGAFEQTNISEDMLYDLYRQIKEL